MLVSVIVSSVAWAEKPMIHSPKLITEEGFTANSDISALTPDFSQSHSLTYMTNDTILFENVIVGNERYAMLMRWQSNALKPIWSGILNKMEIPFRTMTIDGSNADWSGISPVVKDAAGDDLQYLDVPGIDNQFIRTYIHPGPHPSPPPVSDSNDDLTRAMIVNFYKK